MGAREGVIKVNTDYLNMVDMEVGVINAEIKQLEEVIQKYRNEFSLNKIKFEELVRPYSVCPGGNQKFGTGLQKLAGVK